MVTRPPASIALVLLCLIPAHGAVDSSKTIKPAAARMQPAILRPSTQALVVRAEHVTTKGLFSTRGTTRTFTVLRPAQAVIFRPAEPASKGRQR